MRKVTMEFDMLEGLDEDHFRKVMVPNFLALVAVPSNPEPMVEVYDLPTRTDIEDDESMESALEVMEALAAEGFEKVIIFFDGSEGWTPTIAFDYHPDKLASRKLDDALEEFGKKFSCSLFPDYKEENGGDGSITLDVKAYKVSANCVDRCIHDFPREDVELDMAAWALTQEDVEFDHSTWPSANITKEEAE